MANERFTLRTWIMMFVGFAVAILLVMGLTALWKRNFREMAIFWAAGAILAGAFYRGRLALLATVVFGFIIVNAGFTAIFHPTLVGISLTLLCGIGFIVFLRMAVRKRSGLAPDDWQKIFERQ